LLSTSSAIASGLALYHYGASPVTLELPGAGGANASGGDLGLSMRVVQFLYHARSVKIAIPTILTRICIQIALVVSIKTK